MNSQDLNGDADDESGELVSEGDNTYYDASGGRNWGPDYDGVMNNQSGVQRAINRTPRNLFNQNGYSIKIGDSDRRAGG